MSDRTPEEMVVETAVRDYIGDDHQVAGDLCDALGEIVQDTIDDAIERAEANDRSTVQSRDV